MQNRAKEEIALIAADPYRAGKRLHGNLRGYWARGFTLAGLDYRIAYQIRE